MPRVRVLQPDPDLEAEGLGAGTEAEMSDQRAQALAARGLVEVVASRTRVRKPSENQALPGAPETAGGLV